MEGRQTSALFFKFCGEWSYNNLYFITVLFLGFGVFFGGRTCSHCKSSYGGSTDGAACITE